MNVLPNISGTIANYPFQSSLADVSGNGLDLITIDGTTHSTPGGVEQYGTMDSCLSGFKFNGSTKLMAGLSAAFYFPGAFTVEFLWKQAQYTGSNQVYFSCCDPSSGSPGDIIGKQYTFLWTILSAGQHPYYFDQHKGSNLGGPNNFFPGPAEWVPELYNGGSGGPAAVHAYAFRRNADYTMQVFMDGGGFTDVIARTSAPLITGLVERFIVGGTGATGIDMPVNNTLAASFRVVNYARTDAEILADAQFMMSGTCGLVPTVPVIDSSGYGPGGPGTGGPAGDIVYDGVAAAQFGIALRQAPRS